MAFFETLIQRLRSWARLHSYSFFSSLGALMAHRVGTLMTVLMLGIAMLLPVGLHITLSNLDRMELEEAQWGSLTVFFVQDVAETEVAALASIWADWEGVESIESISPQQGLEEFRKASGFGDSLELLDSNPLPWVMTLVPVADASLERRVAEWSARISGEPVVDSVSYDRKWLERLAYFLELGHALVLVLGFLFALAVAVVVANTIRLDVAARAEEIEILALVGAYPAFIRQPFLYSGFWYGLLGGVVAMILVNLGLEYLDGPLSRLLSSYGHQTQLQGLGFSATLWLFFGGGLLGLLGAAVAVQRHLRQLRKSGSLGRR